MFLSRTFTLCTPELSYYYYYYRTHTHTHTHSTQANMNLFEDSEEDWDREITWDALALILQRNPIPPMSRGSTPPPSVVINRNIVFVPQPLPPYHLRIIMDTSVVSLILDVLSTCPSKFFGYFPGLRQVVGDVGLYSQPAKENMMKVPKIRRSVFTYEWFKTKDRRNPVAEISITKTVHGELMCATQVM